MDPALVAFDFAKAGAILADMVESYLAAGAPPFDPEGPDDNEFEDRRPTPVAASLRLHPPIDDGASPLQPGEHGATIQPDDQAGGLGWKPDQIRILDRDLGQSGAAMTNREDFKVLVSDVAMGRVGAIFSLEASRLARSNQDWHRLLELCAITSTLVIDEDGCYDPAEFNDSLILGMKGTFAQAELRFPLPVGFVHDGSGIVLDPDLEVQGAVRTV